MRTQFAKRLRLNATIAERRLWRVLRNKRFAGLRFRRQQPIGPYIVDFYCSAARLIIELDGAHHADGSNPARDEVRSRWLEVRGYRILRFWNSDILNESEVLAIVQSAIAECGVPLPEIHCVNSYPPSRGG
jgi:very-short-patch-repair endonuclease